MLVFFGGWHFPGLANVEGVAGVILKLLILAGKMALFIVFYMLIRWTIPRFRFDQLMGLAWRVMIPLLVANLVAVLFVKQFGWTPWLLLPLSLALLIGAGYLTLVRPSKIYGQTESLAA
jgi:NADH-quinone oxidoreductase subunit H